MATTIYSNSIAITKAPNDGVSVVNITKKYLLTTTDTAPSKEGNKWLDEPPVMTEVNKYLWSYDIVHYSDESTTETDVTCIGVFGERGNGAVTCYLSQEGFILPVNEYGVIAEADLLNVQVVFSLIQLYNGNYKYLTLGDALNGNGSYTLAVVTDSISYISVDSTSEGGMVHATTGSVIPTSASVAYITLTFSYIDFGGKTGTIERKVSIAKAQDGKTGAYTIHQWILDSSSTDAPSSGAEWQNEMPNLANTDKWLWVRKKVVPKGTDPDTVDWGTPELETTLRYYLDGACLMMGNKQISLAANKILLEGSVTATEIDVSDLMASDLEIQDKTVDGKLKTGKIRSKDYAKGEWNRPLNSGETEEDRKAGFYMDNEGYLESTRGFFRHATVYDLTMVGGEIRGEDNPLNTLVSSSGKTSFKNRDGNFDFLHGETFRTFIMNKCPTVSQVTAEDIADATEFQSNFLYISGIGAFNYVANVSPQESTVKFTSNEWSLYPKCDSSIGHAIDYVFHSISAMDGMAVTLSCVTPVLWAWAYSRFLIPTTKIQYKIDDGEWIDSSYSLGYDLSYASRPSSGHSYSFTVYPGDTSPHTVTARFYVSFTSWEQYTVIYYEAGAFTESIGYKFRYSGYLAFKDSIHNFVNVKSLSLGEYVQGSYENTDSGADSDSLPKYSCYSGMQKKGESDSSYSIVSSSGAISARNIVISGVSYGEGTVVYTSSSIIITASGRTLLDFSSTDFYTSDSYPSFSFESLSQEKGAYVDDIFVKTDSSGAYKGGGNIGSGAKPFENLYANFLTGKSATLTESVGAKTVKAGNNSKILLGEDSASGYVNLYNVNQGSDGIFWRIDASGNILRFVRNGSAVPAYVDQDGLRGAYLVPYYLADTETVGADQQKTINLSDSIENYEFIIILCWFISSSATYYAPPVLIHTDSSSLAFNDSGHRLVISTDAQYASLYFPSNTTVATYDSSSQHSLLIYGLK